MHACETTPPLTATGPPFMCRWRWKARAARPLWARAHVRAQRPALRAMEALARGGLRCLTRSPAR